MADRVAKLMIRSIGNCPNRLGSGKRKKLSLVLQHFIAIHRDVRRHHAGSYRRLHDIVVESFHLIFIMYIFIG